METSVMMACRLIRHTVFLGRLNSREPKALPNTQGAASTAVAENNIAITMKALRIDMAFPPGRLTLAALSEHARTCERRSAKTWFNINPVKLEQLLHRFFGEWCLDVDIFDGDGRRHVPREWFIAPLIVIEQAIQFVITGEIVQFQYDGGRKEIVARNEPIEGI
jgi:hypothetical protein